MSFWWGRPSAHDEVQAQPVTPRVPQLRCCNPMVAILSSVEVSLRGTRRTWTWTCEHTYTPTSTIRESTLYPSYLDAISLMREMFFVLRTGWYRCSSTECLQVVACYQFSGSLISASRFITASTEGFNHMCNVVFTPSRILCNLLISLKSFVFFCNFRIVFFDLLLYTHH